MPAVNSLVTDAIDPPIAEAQSWIAGRKFPAEKPLLDMAQAVPSYPPAEALRQHLAERVMSFEAAQYTAIRGIMPLRAALAHCREPPRPRCAQERHGSHPARFLAARARG